MTLAYTILAYPLASLIIGCVTVIVIAVNYAYEVIRDMQHD